MIPEFSIINIILISVFALSSLIQLYFYAYLFPKVWNIKSQSSSNKTIFLPPISVIIAARNEAINLEKNLLSVLNQDYPMFELIVVCDHPTDNSYDLLLEIQKSYKNLTIINDQDSKYGKKAALSLAINKSSYENLVFTDADCQPISKFWLKEIASSFSDTKHLILGFGGYLQGKSFLNSFIRYDAALIALQYFGAAIVGKAYMGVGRNLAYTKTLWKTVGGFSDHESISSGDDDLFVIAASTKENTEICLNPDSFTYSEAKKTWKSFLNQKARHISTSTNYKIESKIISGAEIVSRAIFWGSLILLSVNGLHCLGIFIAIIRTLLSISIQAKVNKTLKTKISVFYVILFDTFAPFFYGLLVIYKLLIHSNKQW